MIWSEPSADTMERSEAQKIRLANYTVQLIFFYLYLMLYTCAVRFDVMENLKNFANFFGNYIELKPEFFK